MTHFLLPTFITGSFHTGCTTVLCALDIFFGACARAALEVSAASLSLGSGPSADTRRGAAGGPDSSVSALSALALVIHADADVRRRESRAVGYWLVRSRSAVPIAAAWSMVLSIPRLVRGSRFSEAG